MSRSHPLTPEQIASYHKNGYLHIPLSQHNLIAPSLLDQYAREVQSWPLTTGKWMPYNERLATGELQLMRTENFVPYHTGFADLLLGSGINALLSQLRTPSEESSSSRAGAEDDDDEDDKGVALFKDKINYKLARGNGFRAHLDAPAYSHITSVTRPGREIAHITANFAVDAAGPENGCIEVVPGSHRVRVPLEAGGGAIEAAWEARQTWTPVPLAPGDLLVFGSVLAHRSEGNQSAGERRSVYATYYWRREGEGLREKYYADRRERFPPDHERIPGKDYTGGVQRYAFAAPFTKIEPSVQTTEVAQEVI